MDNNAVKEIAKLANLTNLAKSLEQNNAIVIPDGYKLQSLENLQEKPNSFKACFSTSILQEFTNYVLEYSQTLETSVFINPEKMTATAIIDQGTHINPDWGKHRANLNLKPTPAYVELLKFTNAQLSQQDLIDFLEDWKDLIAIYFDDSSIADEKNFPRAIKNIRNLKINATKTTEQTQGNFNASRSALESIEIKSGSDQLPAGFLFNTIPFEGFKHAIFDCQLRAMPGEKTINLKYRIAKLDNIAESISKELREKIIENLTGESINIFIGDMQYQ